MTTLADQPVWFVARYTGQGWQPFCSAFGDTASEALEAVWMPGDKILGFQWDPYPRIAMVTIRRRVETRSGIVFELLRFRAAKPDTRV